MWIVVKFKVGDHVVMVHTSYESIKVKVNIFTFYKFYTVALTLISNLNLHRNWPQIKLYFNNIIYP